MTETKNEIIKRALKFEFQSSFCLRQSSRNDVLQKRIDTIIPFRQWLRGEDKNLVFELSGKTSLERRGISRKLYKENRLNAEFKLYPNTAHKVTPEMIGDVLDFLLQYMD